MDAGDGCAVRVRLKTLRGDERDITVWEGTTICKLREQAAKLLEVELEEATIVAFGRRWADEDLDEAGEDGAVETIGDLAWAPLGAVDSCVRSKLHVK